MASQAGTDVSTSLHMPSPDRLATGLAGAGLHSLMPFDFAPLKPLTGRQKLDFTDRRYDLTALFMLLLFYLLPSFWSGSIGLFAIPQQLG